MSIFSYDYNVGENKGGFIEWFNMDQFSYWRGEKRALFAVYGKLPIENHPKPGDTLYAEFKKTYMLFKFYKVTPSHEQPTVFFGEVHPIQQIIKDGEVGNVPELREGGTEEEL